MPNRLMVCVNEHCFLTIPSISKGKSKDMSDDRDQNNKSLDSYKEGDGSDGEDDELEPISNKDWFNLGRGVGGGDKRGLVTKSSNITLLFTNQKAKPISFHNSWKY